MVTFERWREVPMRDQLLHIGAAISRAASLQGNERLFKMCLDEARHLADLTLRDERWQERRDMLAGFRAELEKFYTGERTESVQALYDAL
jgi:hypothetical protein